MESHGMLDEKVQWLVRDIIHKSWAENEKCCKIEKKKVRSQIKKEEEKGRDREKT